jgi:prefoldin beta subunit
MTEPKKEVQEKINKLSTMEQSLQQFLAQKQQFQAQLIEINSALEALEGTEKAYKIVGNVMIDAKKDDLKKELTEKKEMVDIRVKTLEKQEEKTREKTQELQAEVMKEMGE